MRASQARPLLHIPPFGKTVSNRPSPGLLSWGVLPKLVLAHEARDNSGDDAGEPAPPVTGGAYSERSHFVYPYDIRASMAGEEAPILFTE